MLRAVQKELGDFESLPFFKKRKLCPFLPSTFLWLAEKNLKKTHWKVLMFLISQVPQEPLMRYKKKEIADALGLRQPDVHAAYQELEKQGILKRVIIKKLTFFKFCPKLLSKRVSE